MAKSRLDQLLVVRGLAESRSRAQALIMAGLVYSGDKKLNKAGAEFLDDIEITVRGKEHPWVSRGGIKLAHALKHFTLDVNGLVAIDVGASTGGFTDVLLTNGASKVYAVDVGHGQLDSKLRTDPRVVVMENTNARNIKYEDFCKDNYASEPSPRRRGEQEGGSDCESQRRYFGKPQGSTRMQSAMLHAEALRQQQTDAEKRLWQHLRAKQLEDVKFRRQQSIGHYIVDFVSMEHKLIIELDGGQHAESTAGYDQQRTEFLQHFGYRVVRYWNHEVSANTDGVLQDIIAQIHSQRFPPPNLPPSTGGGIFDLIVCDASFISLKKVLPAALALAKPNAQLVTLIKPQFEVGKGEVGKGGVVRDPAKHKAVCDDIAAWIAEQGWQVVGITESPITGPAGNIEFLLYAKK